MRLLNRWFVFAVLCSILPRAAWADKIQLTSTPAGATVRIVNLAGSPQERRGNLNVVTPAEVEIARNREAGQGYVLEFSKAGFQSERVTLDLRASPRPTSASARLEPLKNDREFAVVSTPRGASVFVNDQPYGQTPARLTFPFARPDKVTPWSTFAVRLELPDYQSESTVVALDHTGDTLTFELERIADDRQVVITARNAQGQDIDRAVVEIDGRQVGETPLTLTLPYRRATKTAAWNTFQVAALIPDEYQRVERTVALTDLGPRERPAALAFDLVPVTEMTVVKYFPTVEMTPRGPRLVIDTTTTVGTAVDDRDDGAQTDRALRITSFERKQTNLQAINSFAITPDGQSLIYGVTGRNDRGNFYSNLYRSSTNPSNTTRVELTRDVRYVDCLPTMGREPTSELVIFQSNRGGIESFNISSFTLREGRLVGGIRQLTREDRFNYRPSFAYEAKEIYFISIDRFPEAEPHITSVREDGSAYTSLGTVAEMLSIGDAPPDTFIYFARPAEDSKKLQLFRIRPDGTGIETILSDFEFSQANCHSPAISADGQRLLFVSDYNPDKSATRDNNVWLIELSGTRQPVQLTSNRSDDIQPLWSPTESDIIYFLSNRRGVYNVWQTKIVR